MGTIAERWLKEGEARGEARTRTAILARQLEHRFGPLPAGVRKRIDGATQEQLDTWLDTVLDAPELQTVFSNASGD